MAPSPRVSMEKHPNIHAVMLKESGGSRLLRAEPRNSLAQNMGGLWLCFNPSTMNKMLVYPERLIVRPEWCSQSATVRDHSIVARTPGSPSRFPPS